MPPSYPAGSYPALVVADGAVAYWRLGETSGTTAVDVIGAKNGTISGGVTLGQAGALADGDNAMAFDGTNGLIKMAGMQNYPFGTGPLSVECWLKSTFIAGARWMLDCGKNADNAVPGFEIYQNADHSYTFRPGNGTTTLYLVTPAPLPAGQWLHLVCLIERLYDGVHDRGRIYVNGVHSVSADIAVAGINVTPTAVGMSLGGIFNGGINWGGLLDDVAIYPTALTPAQIAAHYAAKDWKAFGPAISPLQYRWCRFIRRPFRQARG